MSTVGRKLLSAILLNGNKNEFLKLKLYPALFKEKEGELFEYMDTFVNSHGSLPHIDTVEAKLGEALVEAKEPISYYMQEVEKRYLFTKLKVAILTSQDALKEDNPEKALATISDLATELHQSKYRHQLMDFREAADLIHSEYLKQKGVEDDDGVYFGWPTLDGMSSGLKPGDFVSINGRPAMGKTFMLLYGAHHGWRKGKSSPLFVSMEMHSIIINQRLAAMDTHKALTQIMKGTMSTKAWQHMMQSLEENKQMEKPLWVVDANMASTPEDIIATCRHLHPTSCWVDGGYLLRSTNTRMGKFERIGTNADTLKQRLASDLGIPVVVSYQLNREVLKKKGTKEKAGVEDIYGNDAIGQLSSLALGLFQEETVETKIERTINIMKGRSGEVGEFKINWNFQTMDFTEVPVVEKKDLNYMG